jgi:hypothetical protein
LSKRKPLTTLVWVRWVDASYQHGECGIDDLTSLIELESAGLLVREDDESLSLALDWCPKNKEWRHVSHIPKINIREMRKVQV